MALTDNLISFWELGEASGTRVDAVTASANNLTDNNTVTQAVGKVGNAGKFTLANSEFLSRAHNASLATGNIDQTHCAWVYLDSEPGTDMTIVSKQRSGAGEYSLIWQTSSQLFEWTHKDGGSTYVVTITASTFGATNTATWYFVVAWFDSVAGIGYISVNDGAANSAAKTGTPATDATTDFSIGSRGNPGPTEYWDGRVDQAGLWKRVLTAAERTFLYNSGNGRSYAEIVGAPSSGRILEFGALGWNLPIGNI